MLIQYSQHTKTEDGGTVLRAPLPWALKGLPAFSLGIGPYPRIWGLIRYNTHYPGWVGGGNPYTLNLNYNGVGVWEGRPFRVSPCLLTYLQLRFKLI